MTALLFMNLAAGISAFLLGFKVLKPGNFVDSLLASFICYFTQIIATELLLGICGILYLNNLILLNLAVLLIIWLICAGKKHALAIPKPELRGLFKNRIALFCACLIVSFGAIKILINLLNPPFGWDDLNYHFTFPVEWLKTGNLNNPITIADDPSPSYYPLNGSLIFLWCILPLRDVFLADVAQVPFFILAFLAVYSICRKLDLTRGNAYFAACLFTLIPNYFKQLQIAYVDVMVGALFLVCLNWLFLLQKQFSLGNVLIFSLSLGLLLGTKTLALPYAALLLIPFLYLSLKNGRGGVKLLPVILLTVIALGGFSYIRNFLETGNPLYPLDLQLFGRNIFKGVMDAETYRAHFKPQDYSLTKFLFHEGLGVQTLIFIFPAVFIALPVFLLKRKGKQEYYTLYFLALPVLLYLAFRYIIPLANTRYLYPLLGVGMISGFYLSALLKIPKRIIAIAALICALASMPELAKRQELVTSIISTFLLFCLALLFLKYKKFKLKINRPLPPHQLRISRGCIGNWCGGLFAAGIFVLAVSFLTLAHGYYLRNEYARYVKMVKYSGFWPPAAKAWEWLNRNTRGENIAYTGRPVPFPLYGSGFKNNVYYVSVNALEPAKLHYFKEGHYRWGYDFLSLHRNLEERGNYRGGADYAAWSANLKKRNTNYLFVYSLHQTKDILFPMEDAWAKSNTGKFKPVFSNDTIHIYKIIK